MLRVVPIAILLLLQAGCLGRVTRRIDRFEAHALYSIQQLEIANASIVESNQHMKRMAESAERMERYMKRFGGGTEEE